VTLDSQAKTVQTLVAEVPAETTRDAVSALEILLDGVESRVKKER